MFRITLFVVLAFGCSSGYGLRRPLEALESDQTVPDIWKVSSSLPPETDEIPGTVEHVRSQKIDPGSHRMDSKLDDTGSHRIDSKLDDSGSHRMDSKLDYHQDIDAKNSSKRDVTIHLMNALLNCKPFARFMDIVKTVQVELPSLQRETEIGASSTGGQRSSSLTRRVRMWSRKLMANVRHVFRSCLPSASLRKLLQRQLNTANFSKMHTGRNEKINQDIGVKYQKYQVSGTAAGNADRTFSREPKRNKQSHNSVGRASEIRNRKRKVDLLANEILRLPLRNGEIDAVSLLQNIINLDEDHSVRIPQPFKSHRGPRVNAVMQRQIREVPPYFLSVAVGARIIQHGTLQKLASSPRFLTLVRGLSPALLRYGGTYANFVLYDPDVSGNNSSSNHQYPLKDDSDEGSVIINDGKISVNPQTKQDLPRIEKEVVGVSRRTDGELPSLDSTQDTSNRGYQQEDTEQDDAEDMASSIPDGHSDACPFDSDDHSHYISKPSGDSTYDLLAAMMAASDRGYEIMQDEPFDFPDDLFCGDYNAKGYVNFTMSADDWATLADMTESVGMMLLFDVNQFYRTTDQQDWDPANARMIFHDASARGDSVVWQLGNEANSYHHKFGVNFTGQQDAEDFHHLYRELLDFFHQPAIVGPDVTRPHHPAIGTGSAGMEVDCNEAGEVFLRDFLSNLQINLTAITWHQYYIDGRIATVEDFISPEILDYLSWQIPQIVQIRDEFAPSTPVWLTETSAAWGGGAKNLSNRYADGFSWLDKLGMAASAGVDVVTRQTLYSGNYALIDEDFNPNPSYWLSYVYKNLVGGRVMNLTLEGISSTTRLYAHCQKADSFSYEPGNVVIFGMNLADTSVDVKVEGIQPLHFVEQYLLEPAGDDLQSSIMLLNGEVLQMTSEEELPALFPRLLPHQDIEIPPTTFGFWVIVNADVIDCY